MTQNIFIVHTPFHVFMADMIIKQYFRDSMFKNILLLELKQDVLVENKDSWAEIISLDNVGKSTLGHERYGMGERNIEIIKQYMDKNKDTHIFMSDIAWPMNNRIFFDKQLRRMAQFSLFSDGIGTYSSAQVTKKLYFRGIAKSLNGFFRFGLKYTNYWGDQFGMDRKEVRFVYATNVYLIPCEKSKRKDLQFTLNGERLDLNKKKCLFLDQPYWLHISESSWQAVRNWSINYLKSLGCDEYYFKGHHFSRKEERVFFEKQGFVVLESNKCAEQIVHEHNFGIVISFTSSALFNLKCMYQHRIRCISMFSKKIVHGTGYNEDDSEKLFELFKHVEVEIVDTF